MSLAARLSSGEVLALAAEVTHARRGSLRHAFRTSADFVLLAPESCAPPTLMRKNRFGLISFHDRDHGGARGGGQGAAWAKDQFRRADAQIEGRTIALLAQPRFLGYWFNPVSFWCLLEGDALLGLIAEVNNTFGQRHSYLLMPPDGEAILPTTPLTARKCFHVSPFQDVAGEYHFSVSLSQASCAIRIRQIDGAAGVETAMSGSFRRLTPARILGSALRRPGGALRVLAQIYWHALRLKLKGARYRRRPALPSEDVSR